MLSKRAAASDNGSPPTPIGAGRDLAVVVTTSWWRTAVTISSWEMVRGRAASKTILSAWHALPDSAIHIHVCELGEYLHP